MVKFFALFRLGIKYLYRYRRRYGFLLIALIVGFGVVTFITSAKDGMSSNVYFSAQSHYAGDIVASGYSHDFAPNQRYISENDISAILNAADISGINPRHTIRRTVLGNVGVVYFNGNAVRIKSTIGCDWYDEEFLFNRMVFDEPPDSSFDDDGIILSVPTAKQLGARMGDLVVLEIETNRGQKNTGSFIIKGIVQDTSIFGYYKAYISKLCLNRLLLYGDEDCSTVGFFFDDPAVAEQKRKVLQKALDGQVQTGPLVYDRDELEVERSRDWAGTRVFLFTMPVYLAEIADLLNAMNLLTYFLYGMMLLIILVSAIVTYRLIINERIREMGVMRAIGFYGVDLRLVLWTEIIALGFVSLLAGFLLALILSGAASLLSFSWFPGFEIFLKNGKLTAMYLPATMLVNVVTVFLILFATALIPSFRVSNKNLSGLLSGEPL